MKYLKGFNKSSVVLEDFLKKQKLKNNSQETIDYYKKRIGYFIDFTKMIIIIMYYF